MAITYLSDVEQASTPGTLCPAWQVFGDYEVAPDVELALDNRCLDYGAGHDQFGFAWKPIVWLCLALIFKQRLTIASDMVCCRWRPQVGSISSAWVGEMVLALVSPSCSTARTEQLGFSPNPNSGGEATPISRVPGSGRDVGLAEARESMWQTHQDQNAPWPREMLHKVRCGDRGLRIGT